MSAPLTYGSVCSGMEAATLAWRPLGWKCAFVSEIEKGAGARPISRCSMTDDGFNKGLDDLYVNGKTNGLLQAQVIALEAARVVSETDVGYATLSDVLYALKRMSRGGK